MALTDSTQSEFVAKNKQNEWHGMGVQVRYVTAGQGPLWQGMSRNGRHGEVV